MSARCACGGKAQVLDSRPENNGGVIRRRRVCLKCGRRWTTREVPSKSELPRRDVTLLILRVERAIGRLEELTRELRELMGIGGEKDEQ